MSVGGVRAGAVVSTMVTAKWPVLALPAASVAVTQTVVVPSGKKPEAWSAATRGAGSTGSVAVAVGSVTTAPPSVVASTTRSGGSVSVGGVMDRTVILNAADLVLPRASVADATTVVVP